jgi:hypothetical protein
MAGKRALFFRVGASLVGDDGERYELVEVRPRTKKNGKRSTACVWRIHYPGGQLGEVITTNLALIVLADSTTTKEERP